jgi:hypothetical protein
VYWYDPPIIVAIPPKLPIMKPLLPTRVIWPAMLLVKVTVVPARATIMDG